MGFPRQEYWSGLPFPPPGDLADPGIEPTSPALQVDSLPLSPGGSWEERNTQNTYQSFQHMIVYVSGQIFPNNPCSLRSRHADTPRNAHSSWRTIRKCIILGFQQLKSSLGMSNENQGLFNTPLRSYLRLKIGIILKELMCLWPRFLLYPVTAILIKVNSSYDFGSSSKISFRVTGYSQ